MSSNSGPAKPVSVPDALKAGDHENTINVDGVEISWNTQDGRCHFRGIPVAMMWVDSTLAGLMSGVQAMVGPDRFNLALQAEGRKSVESDWLLISAFDNFVDGFAQLNLNAKVAGWGDWQLVSYVPSRQECIFRAYNNWEGGYQRALGVCWGSGMLAGKFAGICGKLFSTNCWATQTRFVAKGDSCDEFVVAPSERNLEREIENLLSSDQATRADMAVALRTLQNTEKILRESKHQYDRLVSNIPVGVYLVHTTPAGDFTFKYVSPRFCALLNVVAEDVYRDPQVAFGSIHPDDLEDLKRINQAAIRSKEPFLWEGRTRVDGKIGWLRIESTAELMTTGECLWDGQVADITKSKQAEESLKLSDLVYQNSSEAILVADADSCIIAINPAFTAMTGYVAAEVIGQTPRILKSGRQNAAFYKAMWDSINRTGHWRGEIWNRRKNGDVYAELLTINTIYNEDGSVSRRVALFSDITDQKYAEALIWNQANYDQLTQFPNRRLFQDRLEQEMKKSLREKHSTALLFVDLDRFKEVNDTLGHDVGDLLLIEAAKRIKSTVRDYDTVARLGGDEFTVILAELSSSSDVGRIAQNIIDSLTHPFQIDGRESYVSASIGISLFPEDATSVGDLLRNADQAMYQAKENGRGRYHFFTKAMQEASEHRMRLAGDLRHALERNQLEVYYQPIVDLTDDSIDKAEALLRWNHPERGRINPATFIPIAEDTGTIHEIGDWVFLQATSQARRLTEVRGRDFQISVNMSPVQLGNNKHRHGWWAEKLHEAGVSGHNIVMEITEGLLMNESDSVVGSLLQFRDAGIQTSIDDFGTGFSALSYLKKFDIDFLKIDRSFTTNLALETEDFALCEAIVVMAHKLGLKVVAEGVETRRQLDLLKQIGCDYGQGYLFAPPLAVADFEALLKLS